MPFTVSHVAAVIPIAWLGRGRLPVSALVIGAMVPDLAGFFPFLIDSQSTHSISGIVTHCAPLGLLTYYAWHTVLKRPCSDLLPDRLGGRIRPWIEQSVTWTPTAILIALCCVIVGSCTHVVWDAFTHLDGWLVQRSPTMRKVAFYTPNRSVRWFQLAQLVSSLLIIPMMIAGGNWVSKLPLQPKPNERRPSRRRAVWIAAFCLLLATGGYFGYMVHMDQPKLWGQHIAIAVKLYIGSILTMLLIYSLGLQLQRAIRPQDDQWRNGL